MFHFQRTRDRDGDPSKRSYSILRHIEPDEQKQTVGWFSMKGIGHDRTIVAIECLLTTTEPERAELLTDVRSFIDELALNWVQQADELVEPDSAKWTEHPEIGFRCDLVFHIA